MATLEFDEELVQGTPEEIEKRTKLLLNSGCVILHRSISRVVRSYLTYPSSRGRPKNPNAPLVVSEEDSQINPPFVFSNQSFVRLCYEKIGVSLPEKISFREIHWSEIGAGDLIAFTPAESEERQAFLLGIVTDSQTLVYACPFQRSTIERPLEDMAGCFFHGVKQFLPDAARRKTPVVMLPPTSDRIAGTIDSPHIRVKKLA